MIIVSLPKEEDIEEVKNERGKKKKKELKKDLHACVHIGVLDNFVWLLIQNSVQFQLIEQI